MGQAVRLQTLSKKHSTIEDLIESELRHPLPDTLRISDLKRQKLQLKDEIQQLKLKTG